MKIVAGTEEGKKYLVKLDGYLIPAAYAADDEEGWVEFFVRYPDSGRIMRSQHHGHPDSGPLKARAYGVVEFVPVSATVPVV